MDLFDIGQQENIHKNAPLAYRMRPRQLEEVVGQKAIAPGSVLRKAIEKDQLHSFVLFGPPGTGKTSIARIIAQTSNSHFQFLPAVTSGVSDIKKSAAEASGLANPQALMLATETAQAVQFVGMPEARIPLAEAVIYLAAAPKSNSSLAIDAAIAAVRQSHSNRWDWPTSKR